MRERLRHNSNNRSYRLIVLFLLIIGIGTLLPKFFSTMSYVLMMPIHSVNTWINESSDLLPILIRTRISLDEEIKDLKNQLIVAGRLDLTQRRLWEENNRLRNLLGVDSESRIAAAVIARPDELPYDFLQIDKGLDHGIDAGAPVFIGKDIVIGLVVHSANNYSFVELFTSPHFKATTFISGPNVVVPMEGMGNGVARVRVPQGINLKTGNIVYLPSIEPGVFGQISYIENEPTQPEQYGYLSYDVPISGLYLVSVGKSSQITRSVDEIDEKILEIMRNELLIEGLSVGVASTSSTTTISGVTEVDSINDIEDDNELTED